MMRKTGLFLRFFGSLLKWFICTMIFPHPGFVTESTPLQPSWRGEADLGQQG